MLVDHHGNVSNFVCISTCFLMCVCVCLYIYMNGHMCEFGIGIPTWCPMSLQVCSLTSM
jgi:hypothetical protein